MTLIQDADSRNDVPNPANNGLVGPILTGGFGTAVLMWVAWYLTHIPGLDLSPARVGVAMMIALLIGTGYAGFLAGRPIAGRVGFGAGALAGALDVLVLLANVVTQPSEGDDGRILPNIALFVPAFIVACAITGAVSAFVGVRLLPPKSPPPQGHDPWLGRFALLTAISFVPLVLIGGSVTSNDAGMSVEGWPRSDGYLMFLYPIELMSEPRVYLEHGHRLFGTFAGLTTIAFVVLAALRKHKKALIASVILLVVVSVQGFLGGLRVTEASAIIGAIHGVLAQLTIAYAAAIAVALSPSFSMAQASDDKVARRLRFAATGLTHSLILQLTLGALYRHLSAQDPAPAGALHVLYTHAGFSIVVVGFALLTGMLLMLVARQGLAPQHVLGRAGGVMVGSIVFQFVLGWVALFLVLSAGRGAPPSPDELAEADPVPIAEALITTTHQANGALLISMAALALVWARRLAPRRRRN